MTLAPGFPVATFTSTSRSGGVGVQSGVSTWIPASTPPGAVYGSSQGQSYLNLRPAADNATSPSVTTYTFATPTPATGWGFVLGDIDADAVQVTATAPDGSAVPVTGLGFAGVFNYCDASPKSSGCSGVNAPFDLPTWDPGTATLTGNPTATDTNGAAGWFRPTTPLKTLTFTYRWRSGLPVYQTWFATTTRTLSGTVTADGAPLAGVTIESVDGTGAVVTTATTAADGTYTVDGLAPGSYTTRAVTPDGYLPAGPTQRSVDLTAGDTSGVDFAFDRPADLTIAKTVDSSPVIAGEAVHYTLTATNNGPATATGVSIVDAVPAGLTGVAGQVTGGAACTLVGTTLTCPVGSLADGGSATVTVTGDVPPDATPGTALINSATVTGDQDPRPADNRTTVASTITASADLAIVKTFTPDTPVAGGPVSYQLTVTNGGPSRATGLAISDPLDPAVTFGGVTTTGGDCDQADGIVSCTVPTLDPGQSVTITVQVTLAADSPAVQNTASVTAATPDPDPENNTGTATFEPTRHSSLSLTKTATPITAAAGQVVGYQLTVTNGGPSDAPNVLLTDSLPAGLTAVAVTDDAGGTCTIAEEVACRWDTVPAGENRQVSLTGTVAADAPNGALINTAAVTAPVDDPDQTDNAASATIQIASTADLRLAKTATPDPAVRGAPVTYTLNVANAGPQRAELLHLEDPIPTGVTVTAVDDSDCSFDDVAVTCLFSSLDAGDQRTITVTAHLAADYPGDELVNTGSVTSLLTPDPDHNNNTATATLAVTDPPASNLVVTKTAASPTVDQLGTVTFTVTVTNDGPADQTDVVITESPDPGLVITAASPSSGTWDGDARTWTLPTLAAGAGASLTVAATAVGVGAQTNTATLTGSGLRDIDPTDNEAAATVQVQPVADLALTKTVSAGTASPGDQLTYRLAAMNNGPSTGQSVHVVDTLPAGVTGPTESGAAECTITGQTIDCDLGDVPSGGSAAIAIDVLVAAGTTGSVVNTATVSSSTTDSDTTNNTATAEFTATAGTPATTGPTVPWTPPPAPTPGPTPNAGSAATLASTGAPIDQQTALGGLLLTAGALLTILSRRPRLRRRGPQR